MPQPQPKQLPEEGADFAKFAPDDLRRWYRKIRPLVVGKATYYARQQEWTLPCGGKRISREEVARICKISMDSVRLFELRQEAEFS